MPIVTACLIYSNRAVNINDNVHYRYWADVPSLYIQLFYIGLCLLPLGWFLGILSPPEALIFWGLERLLVILLGGSAMATDFRQVRIVRV